jgi:hypothetical protein
MSVTISKFVRVMTDGKIVTNSLVTRLDAQLRAEIAALEDLRDKQNAVGLPVAQLTDHVATLRAIQANASNAQDNATKSDMLESGRSAARRAISTARQRTPDGDWLDVLTGLHIKLNEVAKQNATIPDAYLQKIAATKLAGLRAEQQNLARNTPNPELAQDLSKRVGWASDWSTSAINFGSGKIKTERELWRVAAPFYRREGEKLVRRKSTQEQGKQLIALADSLKEKLVSLEKEAERNPREAPILKMREPAAEYASAKKLYEAAVLAPDLTPKVQKSIKDNPAGSEAKMQEALSPPVFAERLTAVYNIAKAFGAPEIRKLSPGEAVALFSYTTGDYEGMNDLLNEITVPDDKKEREKIEIKIDTALKAMAKLPASPVSPVQRGEKPWQGAEARYVAGNEFTIKAFWSTGNGFSFGGIWQITVSHKGTTGKNVAAFSNLPGESEILFPPGTKFRVKEVERMGEGGRVRVEEI